LGIDLGEIADFDQGHEDSFKFRISSFNWKLET
jgi:hypothetical protein